MDFLESLAEHNLVNYDANAVACIIDNEQDQWLFNRDEHVRIMDEQELDKVAKQFARYSTNRESIFSERKRASANLAAWVIMKGEFLRCFSKCNKTKMGV